MTAGTVARAGARPARRTVVRSLLRAAGATAALVVIYYLLPLHSASTPAAVTILVIGLAVKTGAPKPDIGTLEAFKRTLLAANSIAYSDSASGVYIEREMYKKLGLEDELKPKSRMIVAERVGNVVARGEAELGFQQVAELLPIEGVTYVGTIPEEVQSATTFSASAGLISDDIGSASTSSANASVTGNEAEGSARPCQSWRCSTGA